VMRICSSKCIRWSIPSRLSDTTGIIDPNKLLQVQNLVRRFS
jgi:hypothetical protein